MTRSPFRRQGLLIAAAMIGLSGAICPDLGPDPDLATMMIFLPGNDTVIVDLGSGQVESGPIAMFDDINVSVEFYASNGEPDGRVTELRFRVDITPDDSTIVTFTRANGFAGTLIKHATGTTSLRFALFNLETQANEFAWPVETVVN